MTDDSARTDAFGDVINLLAAPIAGGIRAMEQYRRSIDELFRAVDNLNTTMENLNETALRINGLLSEVEEPIRLMMPQLSRSIRAADEMTQVLEGPVRAAAPNLERMVETFSSPGFAALPNQVEGFMHAMSDISKRLGPLTQFAESAGGLFGGLKLPGMPSSGGDRSEPAAERAEKPAAKKSAAKKSSAEKPAAKKSAAKKSSAKKSGAKR